MSRRAIAEVATGAVFLVFENVLHLKLEFLVPCAVGWIAYIAWRVRRNRGEFRDWGVRADNLRAAALPCVVFVAAVSLGMLAWRLAGGGRAMTAHAAAVFLLYPLWAFIQQFMVQALVARNLERLGVARAIVVPVAAVLFGVAHAPDWILCALCAGAGAVWTILYLRTPNLLPLALSHAWLGALTYYWVLGRDPWLEMFPSAAAGLRDVIML